MTVRFWGVRGSIATPGPQTAGHGGNTSCVSVTSGETVMIFDLGTGARALGDQLCRRGPKRLSVFLTHLHADHIAGLPFFAPLHDPRFTIDLYGPPVNSGGLKEQLTSFASPPFFPLPFTRFEARLNVRTLKGGEIIRIGSFRVVSGFVNHPWPTLGYRVENHKVVTYVSDHEPWDNFRHPIPGERSMNGDLRLVALARQADLLILDAQYSKRECEQKRGWGHGTPSYAARMARRAGASKLVLFHHDPAHPDHTLKNLLRESMDGLKTKGGPRVLLAKEGLVLSI